jgi:hypothetical protein
MVTQIKLATAPRANFIPLLPSLLGYGVALPVAAPVAALVAVLVALLAATFPSTAGAVTQLVQVPTPSKADFLNLQTAIPEAFDCGTIITDDAVEFPADDSAVSKLSRLGIKYTVLDPDLEQGASARLEREAAGGYHSYDTAIEAMDVLAAAHPEIMAPKMSIGRTIERREIYVYKISANPLMEEPEPEIFFNAYTHAREAITFEVVYDLARTLVEGYGHDPRVTAIVDTRAIWIEPVTNPDGVQYNFLGSPSGGGDWRKNRRHNQDGSYGVDLNRNFGYCWDYDNVGSSYDTRSETYRGTAAFSEPESAALRDFMYAHRFSISVDYHSFAGLRLFSWSYDEIHTPDYDEMLALLNPGAASAPYPTGTAWEMLYLVNGDAGDWMYGEQIGKPKILAFTPEVGGDRDGFWPSTSRIPSLVAENHEMNLRMCELADNPYRALPPNVSVISSPDSVSRTFTLHWSEPTPDPDNPATRWRLMEAFDHQVATDSLEITPERRWATDGSAGGWSLDTTRAHSGTHSFYSGRTSGRNVILRSLRGHVVQPGDTLSFWTWFNIEPGLDYGYVEASTDGRSFQPIRGSITQEDTGPRNLGHGVTGYSGGWVRATFGLDDYVGRVLWLRFRYNPDPQRSLEGWYIDDIGPTELFVSETLVADNLTSALHLFRHHPEGKFSFLVEAVDAEGDSALWGPPRDLIISARIDSLPIEDGEGGTWTGLTVNGPNPFTSVTTLRFTVPSDGRLGDPVQVQVFDVNGRAVVQLEDAIVGITVQPGATVDKAWAPRDLPSGLYFVHLRVGRREAEKKLIFLKGPAPAAP